LTTSVSIRRFPGLGEDISYGYSWAENLFTSVEAYEITTMMADRENLCMTINHMIK